MNFSHPSRRSGCCFRTTLISASTCAPLKVPLDRIGFNIIPHANHDAGRGILSRLPVLVDFFTDTLDRLLTTQTSSLTLIWLRLPADFDIRIILDPSQMRSTGSDRLGLHPSSFLTLIRIPDQDSIKICKDFSGSEIFFLQAVIDFNIIPQLIRMLDQEEFDIRKECAWAISNATSGGDDMQIKYLVDQVRFFEFMVKKPVSLQRVHVDPFTCEILPVGKMRAL